MPANQTPRCICCTALSFFAVGARLAGEPDAAVYLLYRVIVLRGQASLLQANRALGCICCTALSFFADMPGRLTSRSSGLGRHIGNHNSPTFFLLGSSLN